MLLLLLAFVLVGTTSGATRVTSACPEALPHGPQVPAPLVLQTSCGRFLLARNGTVTRLPRRWFDARAGGTGRRYGADLRLHRTRAGRFILRGRGGRLVWSSHGLYRNDGGSIAFGPGAFAFAAHRRGIFVTDLRSPERLILRGVGLYPLAFLRDGTLLVVEGGWGPSVIRIRQNGDLLARHRYRPKNGYELDERTETLHFVTPERVLVRATATSFEAVRPLGDLDGWLGRSGRFLTLSDFDRERGSDVIRAAVLRPDGRLVSRLRWRSPGRTEVDYGPVASPDGRSFAFRTVTRPRGDVVVYLARAGGAGLKPVLRHRGAQLGCGVGADFAWLGSFVLYSATDGPAAVFDTRSNRAVSLTPLQSALSPSRRERPRVHWAAEFRPNDRPRA